MGRAWRGALLLVVALTACTDDGPACSDAQRVRPDVEVFMEVDATAAEKAGVRQLIRAAPGVRRSVFLSHGESFRLYREVLADEPELAEEGPENTPESFRFQLEDPRHRRRAAGSFERLPGVDWVSIRPTAEERAKLRRQLSRLQTHPDVEVFMSIAATPEQTAAVRAALRGSPKVRELTFLSRDDAYREFQRLFSDQPDLIATTSPAQLPESFRFDIDDRAKSDHFVRELGSLPNVDEVKTSAGQLLIYERAARMAALRENPACLD